MPRDYTSPTPGTDVGATRVMPAVGTELPSVAARRTTGYDNVPIDTAVLPAQQAAAGRKTRRGRRVPLAPLLVLGLGVVLIAGVVYGAYVFLPTATITLRPAATTIAVAPFTVTADPNVAVVDPNAGVIPGPEGQHSRSVRVARSPPTGIDAHDVRAGGHRHVQEREHGRSGIRCPKNTVVSTSDGVDFVTAR